MLVIAVLTLAVANRGFRMLVLIAAGVWAVGFMALMSMHTPVRETFPNKTGDSAVVLVDAVACAGIAARNVEGDSCCPLGATWFDQYQLCGMPVARLEDIR